MASLGAMPVDVPDQLRPDGFLPEGLCQPVLEDLGTQGRRPGPLAGSDDVFELAEVLLPDNLGLAIDAAAFAGVVVDASVNGLLDDAGHVVGHTEVAVNGQGSEKIAVNGEEARRII